MTQLTASEIAPRAFAATLGHTARVNLARELLRSFHDDEIFAVLGDILEPGIDSPFTGMGEGFADALLPITKAYQGAYADCAAAASELELAG